MHGQQVAFFQGQLTILARKSPVSQIGPTMS
jgi:hypothetical protein